MPTSHRPPVKQIAWRQCPAPIEQFFGENFFYRLKRKRHLGRELVGQTQQRHAHDEIDLPRRTSQFQRVGRFFIARHDRFETIIQPWREIADPLWIADEQIDVVTDPVIKGQHQPGAAAQPGVHGNPRVLFGIRHQINRDAGKLKPRTAGFEAQHVVVCGHVRGHVRCATSCSQALTRGRPSARDSV
ncbi:protein of unknown function [Thiomonas sp. Bio17B3]|nr:protein of unknown function [Thiomonas sp. Bio17B3]